MTAIPTRVRQLVGGVWQYVTAEENGGGGGTPTLAEVLAAGNDVEGRTIVDGNVTTLDLGGGGGLIASLETTVDVAIHSTTQDINVTADSGAINLVTDPDFGGNLKVDSGGRVDVIGRGSGAGVVISATVGRTSISSATSTQIESGFGAGIMSMQTDGFAWWQLVEPADADLDAGTFAFWLDPTNGAAKFKIKAKTLDGTVVTGEIALTP